MKNSAGFANFQVKLQRGAGKIQSNKYISAITNGLMAAIPITMIGAIGSLINGLPIAGYQKFLVATNLKAVTPIPTEVTTNLLSLYVVFLIGYKFAESHDVDGAPAGLLALMSFLMVTPFTSTKGMLGLAMSAFPTQWLGAAGLFTAFIVALVSAKIYTVFNVKGWTIKMPDGVPPTVSKSFSSLIPGFVIAFLMLAVRFAFLATSFKDMHSFIFAIVAAPLTTLGGSFPAMLIAVIACQLLWLCGIHGALIVLTVFLPIWAPLSAMNNAAYSAGHELPNMIISQLFYMTTSMGSGVTLGLVIAMLFAKSDQYRTLGRLGIIPNALGINEPIIFGTPLILNFTLAIPFIVMPVIMVVVAYIGMVTGILPYLKGISAPLGTPVLVSGLLMGGWKWVIYQAIMLVGSYFIYLPFFRVLDATAYQKELKAAEVDTTAQASTVTE